MGTSLTIQNHAIWRSAHKTNGAFIPRVQDLAVGDTIALVYRAGQPHQTRLLMQIAEPNNPVQGTVIDEIAGPIATHLHQIGYPLTAMNTVEIIHVKNVRYCNVVLRGSYGGNNAIHRMSNPDVQAIIKQCHSSDDDDSHVTTPLSTPPAKPCSRGKLDRDVPIKISRSDNGARVFGAYVMVDWSSRKKPATGKDSIWIGIATWLDNTLSIQTHNLSTRSDAIEFLRDKSIEYLEKDLRVLMGFDFAFGYPSGFCGTLGINQPGTNSWRTVLNHFRNNVQDDIVGTQNLHNRDAFASQANASINGGGPGPFWGCPTGAANNNLTTRRIGHFTFPYAGLSEFRITEDSVRGIATPQSVWKLNQGVSVGGQTILGLHWLDKFRFISDPIIVDSSQIWPFETKWSLPDETKLAIVEIFPSMIDSRLDLGNCPDQQQVASMFVHAAKLDASGDIRRTFHRPQGMPDADSDRVLDEEGWIWPLTQY